jgi:AraC-like DNA-binding protein
MSHYHFQRQFRREFGCTPHELATAMRIQRARHLLMSTELSITEVCLDVGFESLGSFSSLFRKYVGRSPSHFRRLQVQNLWRPPAIPACFLHRFQSNPL